MRDEGYTTPEGHWLPRQILLPDVREINDLLTINSRWDFRSMSPTNGVVQHPHLVPPPVMIGDNELGPYCRTRLFRDDRQYLSLAVTATQAVVDVVAPRIVTDDDHLSFEIIEHQERERCLVIAQHGYIIGSHWLAYVPVESVNAAIEAVL